MCRTCERRSRMTRVRLSWGKCLPWEPVASRTSPGHTADTLTARLRFCFSLRVRGVWSWIQRERRRQTGRLGYDQSSGERIFYGNGCWRKSQHKQRQLLSQPCRIEVAILKRQKIISLYYLFIYLPRLLEFNGLMQWRIQTLHLGGGGGALNETECQGKCRVFEGYRPPRPLLFHSDINIVLVNKSK